MTTKFVNLNLVFWLKASWTAWWIVLEMEDLLIIEFINELEKSDKMWDLASLLQLFHSSVFNSIKRSTNVKLYLS